MTIKEFRDANDDMLESSILTVRCNYHNPEYRGIAEVSEGHILYDGDYYTMPLPIRNMNVDRFRCRELSRMLNKPSVWDVWVV